ncbi:MAG: hypothetical protein GC178_02445 [Flavobacteriales bacterium]|nr:hypothetical protein [Flavobacteriales bacterium]
MAVSLFSGCYREDTELPFIGYEYFPTELGKYVEYKVDSTWQDDPIGPTAFAEAHYLLRELNESYFTDDEGRQAIRVERYSRSTPQGDWGIKDVWFKVRTPKVAEQNEENVVFIKQNFPIVSGKSWDGNSKNTLQTLEEAYNQLNIPEVWEYSYENINEPYTINGLTFDSTVTVVQYDRPAIFGLNLIAKEVYAKNIGMIHKQLNVFDVQQNQTNPNEKDTVGFFFEMVVTGYGE